MKRSNSGSRTIAATSNSRRELLKAAAVGAGLSLIPGAHALAAATAVGKVPAPVLNLGYLAPGGKSIADGLSLSSARGSYQLSVIGAGVQSPFALAAQYSAIAEHHFWQAWIEQGMLQRSAPITIRFASAGGTLPLNVTLPTGTLTTEIAARPGIYILTIAPASQAVAPWSGYALAMNAGGESMRLVGNGSSRAEVALNYALFEVDRV
jgi:hypothetical protein